MSTSQLSRAASRSSVGSSADKSEASKEQRRKEKKSKKHKQKLDAVDEHADDHSLSSSGSGNGSNGSGSGTGSSGSGAAARSGSEKHVVDISQDEVKTPAKVASPRGLDRLGPPVIKRGSQERLELELEDISEVGLAVWSSLG